MRQIYAPKLILPRRLRRSHRREAGFIINPYSFGGALWTPAQISTAVWLDASDSDTITIATGVSQWADKSGNGYDFTQTDTTDQPTVQSEEQNGLDVIRFDGSDDGMWNTDAGCADLSRNQTYLTTFKIFRKNTADGSPTNRSLMAWTTNAAAGRYVTRIGRTLASVGNAPVMSVRRLDSDSEVQLIEETSYAEQWLLMEWRMNWGNGDGFIFLFGEELVSNLSMTSSGATSNTSPNRVVGLGAYPNGTGSNPPGVTNSDVDIAEVIVLDYEPDAATQSRIEGYLAWKWGLEANLPTGHAYVDAPP